MFGKRILILVAHPDDEVVGCSASIMRARANGATVSALYLTNGCLAREVMWPWRRAHYTEGVTRRRHEAEQAATKLGLQPVGWGTRPARQLWRELPRVFEEVRTALDQLHPDQVWVPAYEGGNPDHDALNAIGAKLRRRVSVLEFSEYNYFGSNVRSQQFISSDETVRVISLSPAERTVKRDALKLYASEKSNLSSIDLHQETYRPLALYDYSQPPHQGTLWYARFQWVPFKHPRVDFTSPAEVSEAIMAFLSSPEVLRTDPGS
ncbi:MAG: PIG-L family deacetylase [Alphaproteobacteria bacterium]|nr:PIG-L family deacetylase [Alphaproteobacteria bacterium]